MVCPICKTQNSDNTLTCEECGWEYVAFLSTPSDEESKVYMEKLQKFRKEYEENQNYIINLHNLPTNYCKEYISLYLEHLKGKKTKEASEDLGGLLQI